MTRTDRSTDEGTDETESGSASSELDVEQEWQEARSAAGLDPDMIGYVEPGASDGAYLSPYLVLYAGFFLGPGLAFVSSLLVGPRQLTVRRVSVMLGICGAAWCAIQGATIWLAPSWSWGGLQMARTTLNFSASAILLLFWRREAPGRFVHSRDALKRSVAAGIVLLAVFAILPREVLAYFGH